MAQAARPNFYCPRTHITARQLRDLGFLLAEIIPDAAFVRRAAVGLDAQEVLNDGTATLRLLVLEPFQVPACVAAVD